ncbi:hypothetical protein SAMN05428983_0534 [Agrobacterium fabrum]|uniref:Uncharacterized protein n=1 Tax=Agrobacterium fabrum TaxID=1176649 RepID=A0A7Z7BGM3_9HYPH|nr:hypothetical protein [Agrobacterium fabrum]SDJ18416.1 hypothetical protein SAMN05428983_0534 [Agrobacterium fabrum]
MAEFIDDHGEVFGDSSTIGLTPYQKACRQLVAFKLKAIETATADPKLHGAPAAQALVVYLSFVTVDKQTLLPTAAYASALTLMARGGIKSDRTARNARSLLQSAGYLEPTGSATKDGCIWYNVRNPRAEVVKMHVREATEYLREKDADRKKEDRRKRGMTDAVPVNSTTPENMCPGNFYPDVPVDSTDKYLGIHLGYSSSGEREYSSVYSADKSGDEENTPLPVPADDAEAESMMDAICDGRVVPLVLRNRLKSMLSGGVLTPRMANNILGPRQEVAA